MIEPINALITAALIAAITLITWLALSKPKSKTPPKPTSSGYTPTYIPPKPSSSSYGYTPPKTKPSHTKRGRKWPGAAP